MRSYFVTEDLVNQAIDLVQPAITSLLGSDLVENRKNIHVAVKGPDGQYFERTIAEDPNDQWHSPYDQIALRKAEECWREGKPSGHLLYRTPWLFEEGDARFAGGVAEDKMAVGVSGLQSHFDEMIAWMIFNAIAALCMEAVVQMQKDPKAPPFLGQTAA